MKTNGRKRLAPCLWLAVGYTLVLTLAVSVFVGWFMVQRFRRIQMEDLKEGKSLMAKIEIVSHSSQLDTLGHLHIFGELENMGEEVVSEVTVTAKFFDEAGATVGERKGPILRKVIRSGERASFDLMYDYRDAISEYELTVTSFEEGDVPVFAMTILEHESQLERAGVLERITIDGQLRNDNPEPVRFPKAVLTAYDENGTVVGASFVYARPKQLLSGEVGKFRIIFLSSRPIAEYKITADGEKISD